ncbi:hypothetical protein DB346_08100 [Verrucomicrobia bacterium LW23]|nr:hypothetical protein DB346_08100 [Verrucomicrobia bacterium LW23]
MEVALPQLNPYVLRFAKAKDVPYLQSMWTALYEEISQTDSAFAVDVTEAWSNTLAAAWMPDVNHFVLIVQKSNDIVGFLRAAIGDRQLPFLSMRMGCICDLYVQPQYRRRHIATRLVRGAISEFKRRDVERIELSIAVANQVACHFWDKLGFAPYMQQRFMKLQSNDSPRSA